MCVSALSLDTRTGFLLPAHMATYIGRAAFGAKHVPDLLEFIIVDFLCSKLRMGPGLLHIALR